MRVLNVRIADGIKSFKDHPQLLHTAFVACAIVAAFLYISDSFVTIARNAEDELANVRVGAIQDSFVPLASELSNDQERLRNIMRRIIELNPTIRTFDIAVRNGDTWYVNISTDKQEDGNTLLNDTYLLNMASMDPNHSFTIESTTANERIFSTARAITNDNGVITAVALTRQGLSEADRLIADSIVNTQLMLGVILIFLVLLFLRHARILDYAELFRRLQEVDKLKDDFLAMASHELRTPLSAIRGYVEILNDKRTLPNQRDMALQRIDISAQRLNDLVSDTLDVSRIEQGRMKFEMRDTDINEVIIGCIDVLRPLAIQKNLQIKTSFPTGAKSLLDPERLRQVILNILGNAIKYTQVGTISIDTSVKGDKVSITIADTGLGMSSDDLSKLCQKFYRSPDSAVRAENGTGLGLWITKQIVEKMSGSLDVQSIKGVGSRFIITFIAL